MSFHSLLVSGEDAPDIMSRCRELLTGAKGRYTLGVAYFSDGLADQVPAILDVLRASTGIERWVGGTAMGVLGIDGEAFDRPALSLLMADLPQDSFRCFGPITGGDGLAALERWSRERSSYLGLVHADPRYPQVPELIRQVAREGDIYLVGGLLSSRGNYVQSGEGVGDGALSGVLFTDALPAATRLSQGCSPIGPRRTMTRAEGSVLMELDGRPALECLAEDLQADGGGAADVHVALPRRGSDTGDYLVRNLMGVDRGGAGLVVGEHLAQGGALMFCRRNAAAARQDLDRMLDELAAAVDGPVQGGIYVSCLARGPNLFPEPALEVGLIRRRFGDIPLAGFYANGEIAGQDLYGYTGVLTVFT